MMKETVEVKESTEVKAGLGLFACCHILKGSRIVEYTGNIITREQARVLRNRDYLKAVSFNKHIDANCEEASVARYINDCPDKLRINVTFKKFVENKVTKIYVVALRNIENGEELFADYGKGFWLFQNVISFLDLKVNSQNFLELTKPFSRVEMIIVFASSLFDNKLHALGKKVKFIKEAEEANCMITVNPFVSDTLMICCNKDLSVGAIVTVEVPSYQKEELKVTRILKKLRIKFNKIADSEMWEATV